MIETKIEKLRERWLKEKGNRKIIEIQAKLLQAALRKREERKLKETVGIAQKIFK